MSIAKMAAALPKGEADGLVNIAEDLVREVLAGREQTPRVAIVLLDCKEAKVDSDGRRIAVMRMLRVEPIEHAGDKAMAEAALHRAFEARTGQGVLPYDMQKDVEEAFGDVVDTAAIDEREERLRETMSPLDELRQHLVRVHNRPEAVGMTETEVHDNHTADHDGRLPEALGHTEDWHGWTRADIESAESESEDRSENMGEGYPHDPDPDLGKDLDDEDDGESGVILTSLDDETDGIPPAEFSERV